MCTYTYIDHILFWMDGKLDVLVVMTLHAVTCARAHTHRHTYTDRVMVFGWYV